MYRTPELTNALVHEFEQARNSFEVFARLMLIAEANLNDKTVSIRCYNTYSDFVFHLYEFYRGLIEFDKRYPAKPTWSEIDGIIKQETEKLLAMRRNRIVKGYAPSYEKHISCYEVAVPDTFAPSFRKVRNCRAHALAERSTLDLAEFFLKYHRFVLLLFDESQWLWNAELIPEHDWLGIERFVQGIISYEKMSQSGGSLI